MREGCPDLTADNCLLGFVGEYEKDGGEMRAEWANELLGRELLAERYIATPPLFVVGDHHAQSTIHDQSAETKTEEAYHIKSEQCLTLLANVHAMAMDCRGDGDSSMVPSAAAGEAGASRGCCKEAKQSVACTEEVRKTRAAVEKMQQGWGKEGGEEEEEEEEDGMENERVEEQHLGGGAAAVFMEEEEKKENEEEEEKEKEEEEKKENEEEWKKENEEEEKKENESEEGGEHIGGQSTRTIAPSVSATYVGALTGTAVGAAAGSSDECAEVSAAVLIKATVAHQGFPSCFSTNGTSFFSVGAHSSTTEGVESRAAAAAWAATQPGAKLFDYQLESGHAAAYTGLNILPRWGRQEGYVAGSVNGIDVAAELISAARRGDKWARFRGGGRDGGGNGEGDSGGSRAAKVGGSGRKGSSSSNQTVFERFAGTAGGAVSPTDYELAAMAGALSAASWAAEAKQWVSGLSVWQKCCSMLNFESIHDIQ
jgi:hypothetical protein